MAPKFNHENLTAYHRAVDFCARVNGLAPGWDSAHAISEHLPRAAESIVENLAQASAAYSGGKTQFVDYSLGSALECAASLDIAAIKRLLEDSAFVTLKRDVGAIFRMLVGLRKSWAGDCLRETPAPYGTADTPPLEAETFHHERLDVYRVALDAVRWLTVTADAVEFPAKTFRKLDAAVTGIVLNVAEGNGRFSQPDQRRFLEMAHCATVKMAAQLDLCAGQRILAPEPVDGGKHLLFRVACMTGAMIKGMG